MVWPAVETASPESTSNLPWETDRWKPPCMHACLQVGMGGRRMRNSYCELVGQFYKFVVEIVRGGKFVC